MASESPGGSKAVPIFECRMVIFSPKGKAAVFLGVQAIPS
jgi:hypothetical protein